MARFFLINGNVGLRKGGEDTVHDFVPPGATVLADAAAATDFDPTTNAQILTDFDTDCSRFSANAGVIRRDGANLTYGTSGAVFATAALIAGVCALRTNRTNNTVTLADCTDMQFALDPNSHYVYSFEGVYTSAATTTGIALAVNGPASPLVFNMKVEIAETATTSRYGVAAAYNTAVTGLNSAGATAMPFRVTGRISTGAAGGTLVLRFASEVAASQVTIPAGCWGELKKKKAA